MKNRDLNTLKLDRGNTNNKPLQNFIRNIITNYSIIGIV